MSVTADKLTAAAATKFRLHRAGTILLPKSGASTLLDHRTIMGVDGYVSSHLATIAARREMIDDRFLYYCLLRISARDLAVDANYPTLSLSQIKSIEVPFPSLVEQRRLVKFLDEAFSAITIATANVHKNLNNSEELSLSGLDGIMERAFETGVPGKLSEHLSLVTYGFTNPMPTTEEGPFMITAKNIRNGVIDYETARHTSQTAFDEKLTAKSRPQIGDVLLTKDGTLGRVAVVDRPGICINQSVALLRPHTSIHPDFLKFLLMTSRYQEQMLEEAGGTTIKHIYITRVDKMDVMLPNLSVQVQAVEEATSHLARCGRLKEIANLKLLKLSALKHSILDDAFSGRVVEPTRAAAA